MSKTKVPATDKPRHWVLDQVPDVLGSNFYGFERLRLLSSSGQFAVRYKNAGSIVVGNLTDKEVKTYKNTANLVISEFQHPHIFSIHDNDSLQVINVESGQVDQVTHKSSKHFSLKKSQALLLQDSLIFCVGAQGILIYNRNQLKSPPREILLQDKKDKNTRVIINVNNNLSATLGSMKLFLANNDVFQVWQVDPTKDEMWMIFEGRNSSSTVKYLNVWPYKSTALTFTRGSFCVWPINKSKDTQAKEYPEDNIITEVLMDDSLIITGDSLGNVILRQQPDGEKIQDLSIVVEGPNSQGAGKKDDMKLLDYNLDNKINVICKVGRWVFVGAENSRIAVYDIFREKSAPVLEYICPRAGSINSLIIENNTLLATWKPKKLNATSSKGEKDKSASAKEKPEIISWLPKLNGFDYYIDANRNGQDSISCVLAYTKKQIMTYVEGIKSAGEEVTELSTTTDHLDDCIQQIYKNPEYAIQFFQQLKKLQLSLDSFEALLEKLTQQGRLVRIFTSSRLRRDLEYQNSVVGNNVVELELRLKTADERKRPEREGSMTKISAAFTAELNISLANRANTQMTVQRESMITDPEGRDFWKANWGNALHVGWDAFIAAIKKRFSCSGEQERQLQKILDYTNTGSVSQYKFAEFLKGFGPFSQCVENVSKILNEPWFHGFLSGRESELLIKNHCEPEGSFIVRFSKSKPGSFALAFLRDGHVNHILVESLQPEGFKILTQETSGSAKMFKTLHELVEHYNYVLKVPFLSDLPKQDWFHGDITTDEANELLREEPVGTYLLRFSSKGTFAASFVDVSRFVRHVLVGTEGRNNFLVDTGSGMVSFPSIVELVRFYKEKNVFSIPLITGR